MHAVPDTTLQAEEASTLLTNMERRLQLDTTIDVIRKRTVLDTARSWFSCQHLDYSDKYPLPPFRGDN